MLRYNTFIALLACALVPLAMIGPHRQQDPIVEQIHDTAVSSGLSRVAHDLYRDWLNQGTQQLVRFDLDADVSYYLVGACDADCAELHFAILDPDGVSIGSLHAAGSRPVLAVDATRRGRYQLRATMRRCSIQPCEWGVRVYRR